MSEDISNAQEAYIAEQENIARIFFEEVAGFSELSPTLREHTVPMGGYELRRVSQFYFVEIDDSLLSILDQFKGHNEMIPLLTKATKHRIIGIRLLGVEDEFGIVQNSGLSVVLFHNDIENTYIDYSDKEISVNLGNDNHGKQRFGKAIVSEASGSVDLPAIIEDGPIVRFGSPRSKGRRGWTVGGQPIRVMKDMRHIQMQVKAVLQHAVGYKDILISDPDLQDSLVESWLRDGLSTKPREVLFSEN